MTITKTKPPMTKKQARLMETYTKGVSPYLPSQLAKDKEAFTRTHSMLWPHGILEGAPCEIDGKVYLEQSGGGGPPRIARGVLVLWYDEKEHGLARIGRVACNVYPGQYRVTDFFGVDHKIPNDEVWICESKFAKATMEGLVATLKLEITDKTVGQVLRGHPLLFLLYLAYIEYTYRYRETADHHRPTDKAHRRVGLRLPYKGADGKINPIYASRSAWLCWLGKRSQAHQLPAVIGAIISREYHNL
jgi:hypothetical protein